MKIYALFFFQIFLLNIANATGHYFNISFPNNGATWNYSTMNALEDTYTLNDAKISTNIPKNSNFVTMKITTSPAVSLYPDKIGLPFKSASGHIFGIWQSLGFVSKTTISEGDYSTVGVTNPCEIRIASNHFKIKFSDFSIGQNTCEVKIKQSLLRGFNNQIAVPGIVWINKNQKNATYTLPFHISFSDNIKNPIISNSQTLRIKAVGFPSVQFDNMLNIAITQGKNKLEAATWSDSDLEAGDTYKITMDSVNATVTSHINSNNGSATTAKGLPFKNGNTVYAILRSLRFYRNQEASEASDIISASGNCTFSNNVLLFNNSGNRCTFHMLSSNFPDALPSAGSYAAEIDTVTDVNVPTSKTMNTNLSITYTISKV